MARIKVTVELGMTQKSRVIEVKEDEYQNLSESGRQDLFDEIAREFMAENVSYGYEVLETAE